jgi:hypothetical protein
MDDQILRFYKAFSVSSVFLNMKNEILNLLRIGPERNEIGGALITDLHRLQTCCEKEDLFDLGSKEDEKTGFDSIQNLLALSNAHSFTDFPAFCVSNLVHPDSADPML